MALLPVGPNPRWSPAAVLENLSYLCNGSSDPLRIWFSGKRTGENNARGVIRLVAI